MSKQVTLNFEIDDIDGLYHTSTRSFYYDQIDRFEIIANRINYLRHIKNVPATFLVDEHGAWHIEGDKGNYMYWLDGYASVLLFTKVLNAFRYSTAVLSDLASEEVNEYVVLTDFAGNWDSEGELKDE